MFSFNAATCLCCILNGEMHTSECFRCDVFTSLHLSKWKHKKRKSERGKRKWIVGAIALKLYLLRLFIYIYFDVRHFFPFFFIVFMFFSVMIRIKFALETKRMDQFHRRIITTIFLSSYINKMLWIKILK